MATLTDDAILKIKYDILLKQFEMLRHKAHQRLGFYIQIYQIYAIGLTAVYGYIVAARHWDILLLFPVISLSLYLRLVWDQKVLFFISDYMNSNIGPWFKEAMECDLQSGPKQQQWMIWDQYYPGAFKTFPPFYKHSAFIVFGLVSVVPSIVYCFYNLLAVRRGLPLLTEINLLHLETGLFPWFMGIAGLAFAGFAYWVYDTTYRHPF